VSGVSREDREALANWLTALGGVVLFASLFLAWSHQFSAAFLQLFGRPGGPVHGVPLSPTAWQVYSTADVLLALLACSIVAAALAGNRIVRLAALIAAVIGLAFAVHAIVDPPTTTGAIFNPSFSVPQLSALGTSAGIGETVAVIGLLLALGGLALSFTAD
jgi:hypothetical protein